MLLLGFSAIIGLFLLAVRASGARGIALTTHLTPLGRE